MGGHRLRMVEGSPMKVLSYADIVCGVEVLDRAIEHLHFCGDDPYLEDDLRWFRRLIAPPAQATPAKEDPKQMPS